MKREELVRYDGEWYDANIVDCLLDEKDAEIEKWKKEFEHDARFISCRMCEEKFKKYIDELKSENDQLKAQIAEAKELSIELQKRNRAIADNAIGNVESYKSKCDAEIESLKAKLEDAWATIAFDHLDAVTRERRLRRALCKACANWAMNARMVEIETEPWGENHESRLWAGVYDKCLKKAEEYR